MVKRGDLLNLISKSCSEEVLIVQIPKNTFSCQFLRAAAAARLAQSPFRDGALTQPSSSTHVSISVEDTERVVLVPQLKRKVTADRASLRCSVPQWHSFPNESCLTAFCHYR